MRRTRRERLGEQGSATLELAILSPAVLALIGLAIVGGRVVLADAAVEQAAAAAAREASLARDPQSAHARGVGAAQRSLGSQGIDCVREAIDVNTAGFAIPVGQPASVSASVACTVSLSDLAVPGAPGQRTLAATVTSPLDRYRSR